MIDCDNFDDFLILYEFDEEIKKLIDEHTNECEKCLWAKKAWMAIRTGKADPTNDPKYQQIAKNVYERLVKEGKVPSASSSSTSTSKIRKEGE